MVKIHPGVGLQKGIGNCLESPSFQISDSGLAIYSNVGCQTQSFQSLAQITSPQGCPLYPTLGAKFSLQRLKTGL